MRTIFAHQPFGRFEVGSAAFGLSQAAPPETAFALEDYLRRIEALADEKTREELKAKYEECKAEEDDARQLACYGALAARLATAVTRPEERPGAAPPAQPPAPRPPEAAFPILPVAIGGLALAGLVVFLATRG